MEYPNKTYVVELVKDGWGVKRHQVIMVVADCVETARQYLEVKLGFKGSCNELIWLMDTNHKTLYDQTGQKKLEVQAKILFNTSTIMK